MFWFKKKAQLGALQGLILGLVVVGLIIALGFLMLGQINTTAIAVGGAGGYAANGTAAVLSAMNQVPTWLPIIVIAVIGAIVFSLVALFAGKRE
jgi:hypothetical protein